MSVLIIAAGVMLGVVGLLALPWVAAAVVVFLIACVEALWSVFDFLVLAPLRWVVKAVRWVRSKLA